ncbi:LysE family translocator [Pseudaestuariivita atlantica]|uniref:Amino acid transporter LysE n=1 Tax=Pseudaestuariivita atlantica TaxID=1317121 RepID=A0A0L1JPS4_9RHOB|nr:LysE family translocator [Pseudaestuariivita atlantica]KNG93717.1 amino acid transporter LysE [Pseudaestuariivita atlantica]
MTLSAGDMALYVGALLILFFTPGPVWVGLIARSLSGGFRAAVPLALGVVVGDVLWPFLAILGVTWVASMFDGVMTVLRWVAAGLFFWMGWQLIRTSDRPIVTDSRLTRPGWWAGFAAGVALILGNPKAILFYMGVLPGFFDLTRVTWQDIAAIVAASIFVPLFGNLTMAFFIGRARALIASPEGLKRLNIVSGLMLLAVGCLIPFT